MGIHFCICERHSFSSEAIMVTNTIIALTLSAALFCCRRSLMHCNLQQHCALVLKTNYFASLFIVPARPPTHPSRPSVRWSDRSPPFWCKFHFNSLSLVALCLPKAQSKCPRRLVLSLTQSPAFSIRLYCF